MEYMNLENGKRYTFVSATDTHVLLLNKKGEEVRIRPDYFKKFFRDPQDNK